MSRNTATVSFQALELKGSLLPASLLEEVSKLNRPKELLLEGHDYGLSRGERLRDRIDAAWVLTKELWEEYGNLRERAGHSTAGLHFGLRLLKEVFGWSGVEPCHGWQHGESRYPITHCAFGGAVPLILRGIDAGDLDRGSKQFGQDERKRSPHSCLQECLNADDSANWGVLLSGDRLRLLHDNPSLVKPAYLAADLELLIEGERFDEFSVLWLLLHTSRFQHPKTGSCVLDDWKQKAEESGERVLGALRGGVQSALESLGSGFLNHPANGALRDALFKNHTLSKQQFHEQLLRLVYRFLFLFTAEDRDLLFPRELKADDPRRRIYREGYSVSRLRELAIKRSAYEGEYGDLWELQRLVFQQLSIGNSPLGLPGLGGLFSLEQCPDLQTAELWNGPLLRAIKAIGWFDAGGSFTRVRYRDLNTEELGSVYEGLLELHPQLEQQGSQWQLSYGGGAGSDRKTTGSYYTPDALVQELIKSALIPVIDDRLSKAHGQGEQEQALLNIKVIDPACGSGHFLLAAARRLAVALAQVRAGDDQPSEDDRQHALRDVVAHCIYAVDRNPMAVELCKVALWIEAIDPGKPLSFLDAHIQCGDSLVGVFDPKVLEEGIPDEAYKPLTGDNKTVCTSLKNENKAARKTISRGGSNRGIQGSLDLSGTQPRSRGQQALQAIEAMPETTLAETAAKQAAYAQWLADRGRDPETLAADLWTAAFFLAKTSDSRATVPTTEHLLKLLSGQPVEEAMEEAVVQAAQTFRFFHWHLRFGEVLREGGFDCVLGNPPWIRQELIGSAKAFLSIYTVFSSSADLSAFFIEKSIDLINAKGKAGLITPNKWLRVEYGKAIRGHVSKAAHIEILFDFGHAKKLFTEADTFPLLIAFSRLKQGDDAQLTKSASLAGLNPSPSNLANLLELHQVSMSNANFKEGPWIIQTDREHELEEFIENHFAPLSSVANCNPLTGIKSGLNEAFYIETSFANQVLAQDKTYETYLKPLIRGRDIKRWTPSQPSMWHIVIPSSLNHSHPWSACNTPTEAEGVFRSHLPVLYDHLAKFKEALVKRSDQGVFWWELRSCDYYEELESNKILCQCIAFHSRFCIDRSGSIINNKAILMPTQNLGILGYLNSSLCWWILNRRLVNMKDGGLSIDAIRLGEIPTPRNIADAQDIVAKIEKLEELTLAASAGYQEEALRLEEAISKEVIDLSGLTSRQVETLSMYAPARDPMKTLHAAKSNELLSK